MQIRSRLTNLRLSTEYWILKNIGLGTAINWFALDVDVEVVVGFTLIMVGVFSTV